jgi:WD40 repeat protein
MRFVHDGMVNAVAFNPDGTRVATASYDHTARVWDSSGAAVATLDHPDWVSDVAFGVDGGLLATAGYDDIARVWQLGAEP